MSKPYGMEELQAEAGYLSQLVLSPGWVVLKAELEARMKSAQSTLENETDIQKIFQSQATVKDAKLLLSFPEHLMETARVAAEEARSSSENGSPTQDSQEA